MRNVPNFRVFKIRNNIISPNDMLPLQSTRHRGSRTRPIQCAESPRAVHVAIQPLRGASHGAECWNFTVEIPMARISSAVQPLSSPCLYASSTALPRPAQFCMTHVVPHGAVVMRRVNSMLMHVRTGTGGCPPRFCVEELDG